MSSLKPFSKLIFFSAVSLIFACDDGAGKPDQESGGEGTSCSSTLYKDEDGDGFGDPDRSKTACTTALGWVDNALDCNDADPEISPDTPERCNGIDLNCDGIIDDDSAVDATDWFRDADGDGFGFGPPYGFGCTGDPGQVANNEDCDDANSNASPSLEEECDGIDNNCDGNIDEGEAVGGSPFYADADEDGWGDSEDVAMLCHSSDGRVEEPGDCDDSDNQTHPEAEEHCDGRDRDCDGHIDSRCNTTHRANEADKIFKHSTGFLLMNMSVGDISGDGIDDVLLGNGTGQQLHLLGSPIDDESISPEWTMASSEPASGIAQNFDVTEDLDGDGLNDLILAHHTLNDGYLFESEVQVHLGPLTDAPYIDSPDTLLIALPGDTRWAYQGLSVADLTHDGTPDAIFTNSSGNVVVVWPSIHTDSELETDTIFHTVSGRTSDGRFASGDFDGDGGADLVFSAGTNNSLSLISGPILTDSDFLDPVTISYGTTDEQIGKTLVLCDLNRDGKDEIVTTTELETTDSDTYTSVLVSNFLAFDVAESLTVPLLRIAPSEGELLAADCADVDGDSHADLLAQSPLSDVSETIVDAGSVSLFFGPTDGVLDLADADHKFRGTSSNHYFGWMSDSGDFDGDGHRELVIGHPMEGVNIFDTEPWLSSSWESSSD